MVKQLKKTALAVLLTFISTATIISPLPQAQADTLNQLPDMGTTAAGTLTINQEILMGDFYVRDLRASALLIYDPLLVQYINQLGQHLVSNAQSVKTPFTFHLLRNDDINAFAFFGGNVVVYSSLFRVSDNENQLAAVLSHEISHVTQRHLARAMEDQERKAPLTWVGALGSILIGMANPQAGMMALTTTIAGTQQGIISFTQSNEEEADRIGLQVLQRSGFDPEGMPDFLQILADMSRYSSKPPKMLLTHPLPESRLSDTRNRANQMPRHPVQSSEDYLFAKVRILGMYGPRDNRDRINDLLTQLNKGNVRERKAATYGQAIVQFQAKNYDAARNTLQPLYNAEPKNLWLVDLMTDIDLAQHKSDAAIKRLEALVGPKNNSSVLLLDLANAYIESGKSKQASQMLYRYTYNNPNDPNGWDLLAQSLSAQHLTTQELAARAESLALSGQLPLAIKLLSDASAQSKLGSLDQARYDARIDQLRQLEKTFRQFQRS